MAARPVSVTLRTYARGVVGGLLFSLPLLYTMEVWWAGFTMDPVRQLTYDQSWGQILQKHRQWRCQVCADHTGELADVSVGDPWYRTIPPGEPGRSLVLVRTARGREVVRRAIASGALVLEPVSPDVLVRSQPNLLHTRGAVWGRTTAMRALGLPAPRFEQMPTFPTWRDDLTTRQKAQSIYGTAKRIVQRRLDRPTPVVPFTATDTPVTIGPPSGANGAGHQDAPGDDG